MAPSPPTQHNVDRARAERIAASLVNVTIQSPRIFLLVLATNEALNDGVVRPSGGVDPESLEAATASVAIALRAQHLLADATRLPLKVWLDQEIEKRGGRKPPQPLPVKGLPRAQRTYNGVTRLAADSWGYKLSDRTGSEAKGWGPAWSKAKERDLQLEIRKIQEYTQSGGGKTKPFSKEKYKTPELARQVRWANLPGGDQGNPYAQGPTLMSSALAKAKLAGGARADWHISRDDYPYTLKMTDPEPPTRSKYGAMLHDAVRNAEQDLPERIRFLVDGYIGDSSIDYVSMSKLFALHLQIWLA